MSADANPNVFATAAPEGHGATVRDVHLVFVPDWRQPRFFLWGAAAGDSPLSVLGDPQSLTVIDAAIQVRSVTGYALPLLAASRALAAMTATDLERQSQSVAAWSCAAKILLDLVVRERSVPRIVHVNGATQLRWAAALSLTEDHKSVQALAKAMPLAAHAIPLPAELHTRPVAKTKSRKRKTATATADCCSTDAQRVWSAESALHTYLDVGVDTIVRMAQPARRNGGKRVHGAKAGANQARELDWPQRFIRALTQSPTDDACATFEAVGFAERSLLDDLRSWSLPALGPQAGVPRICFRFELPDDAAAGATFDPGREQFRLSYYLQAGDDPSVLVPASDVFTHAQSLDALHCTPRIAEEALLKSLVAAGRMFTPIEKSLHQARPEYVQLKPEIAFQFINDAAPALADAGMGVILPAELTRTGRRRLRMRMRVGGATRQRHDSTRTMTLDSALQFRWEAEVDGHLLTQGDLAALAALKAPLVRYRGQWIAVDRDELEQAQHLLAKGGGTLSRGMALAAALAAETSGSTAGIGDGSGAPVAVVAEGELATLLTHLQNTGELEAASPPRALRGELRPYQQRGLAWLGMMAQLGLGACLADDMGLGKTIQLLAFLLHRRERQPEDGRPILLLCPTSVLGNWQRELTRFAPTLPVCAHYGPERARDSETLLQLEPGTVVMTSYGLLRRDVAALAAVEWSVVVLDEAQNIKNAGSRTARIARTLNVDFRVALTGTPVENRLTELWSICEFLNPGMLGTFEGFRREVALPIERFGRDDVADRLKRIVRPLILRRVKSDPTIIADLPPKQEMTVYCTLTREQASLYQAELDAAMHGIEESSGIERRGQVLALITALKQICNHPAQYLHEAGPLGGRSGKLERLREMLDEALAVGDRVLIFTQYREMGERLTRDLRRQFGDTVQYLHGGTPRATRDVMIRRFQESAHGPRIFVLSLKAGGTGLNLTAATQVFHYDRWWNPAVEDQATDRAYRIGQQRQVQVHKFVCAGTIEERVNQMLESKRDLAARIVGKGEQWITELDNSQLRELFSLAPNAMIGGDAFGGDGFDGDTSEVARPQRARDAAQRKETSGGQRRRNASRRLTVG